MDRLTFNALITETYERMLELSGTKGEEYSGKQDALANFKRNGERIGLDPIQIWHVYAAKHYDSICTFVKDITTGFQRKQSEPIEGRIDDLILYLILLKGLNVDRQIELDNKRILANLDEVHT